MGLIGLILIILGVLACLNAHWIVGLLLIVVGVLAGGSDYRSRRL